MPPEPCDLFSQSLPWAEPNGDVLVPDSPCSPFFLSSWQGSEPNTVLCRRPQKPTASWFLNTNTSFDSCTMDEQSRNTKSLSAAPQSDRRPRWETTRPRQACTSSILATPKASSTSRSTFPIRLPRSERQLANAAPLPAATSSSTACRTPTAQLARLTGCTIGPTAASPLPMTKW